MAPELGPTEFVPYSHFEYDVSPYQTAAPCGKGGQAIIMDFRLKHRGLANKSTDVARPMLYITYVQPDFMASEHYGYNFSSQRYNTLPPLLTQSTREERSSRVERSGDNVAKAGAKGTKAGAKAGAKAGSKGIKGAKGTNGAKKDGAAQNGSSKKAKKTAKMKAGSSA